MDNNAAKSNQIQNKTQTATANDFVYHGPIRIDLI